MAHPFGGILFNFRKELFSETTLLNRGNTSRNRTKVLRFHLHEASRAARFVETERRTVAARGRAERRRDFCVVCVVFQFGKMKEFWKWMVVMFIQQWGSA